MTIFPAGRKTTAATPTSRTPDGQDASPGASPSRKGHLTWLIAGSWVTGVLAALLLTAAPFIPATESGVTGAILMGLALGWAMVAILSVRFTDQPQRWAVAPAVFMGLSGFLLVAFGSPMQEVLAWVWPPAALASAVRMAARAHRQLPSRSTRVLVYPVIATLVLASLGSGFETVRGAADTVAPAGEGRLIDVGGHRLYLDRTGSGSPTVVIEPGGGGMRSDLGLMAPAVARDTRVCIYDRAGRGSSDPVDAGDTPQDAAQIATDLHTLLQRGDEPGPYVLAGHSFGGLYALTFTAMYPADVAGLVLVDSTAPASATGTESAHHTPDAGSRDTLERVSALGSVAARLGIGGLLGVTSDHFRSTVDEYVQAGSSVQEAAALGTFDDRPLIVLTAGTGNAPGWAASQDALASLSTDSLHRVIDGATHQSFVADQEDAAAAARGILDVVSAVRTARPLAP
ncbi:pimeloyl-ACP methyl ester carboxylesterase [Arthrobacter sp. CAN_A2]|uniref:alpha/beta fold hydrolase n=1 Tax=Arthrobacter sp. CAN_A2 TaxID=2787718 RepID=UPI001A1D80F2